MLVYECCVCRCALPRVEFDAPTEGRTVVSSGYCAGCAKAQREELERWSRERGSPVYRMRGKR